MTPLEKWLILGLGQRKYKVNLGYLFGPEGKGLLRELRGYVKRNRGQLEGASAGQI